MVSWAHWKWVLIIITALNSFFLFEMGTRILNIGLGLTSKIYGLSIQSALAIANLIAIVILYKELS